MSIAFSKTLNVKEIKDFGKNVLNQALNTRRVVAFVGSGISTAYGRCSWKDMLLDLIDDALKSETLEHQSPDIIEQKVTLEDILKQQKSLLELDENNDSRNYPVILSLCEALYRLKDKDHSEAKFREEVRKMVASHRYHTQQSLLNRYNIFKEFCTDSKIDSEIDEDIQTKLNRSSYCPLFYECGFVFKIREYFSKDNKSYEHHFLNEVWNRSVGVKVCDSQPHDSAAPIKANNLYRTDERNIFSVMLLAIELTDDKTKNQLGKLMIEKLNELLECDDFDNSQYQSPQDKMLVRYELARPVLDPLHKIYSTLNISRFLTTNYDLEIERYLENLDFPLATLTTENDNDKQTEVRTKSRLGQEARSLSFIPRSAGDLMDFAVGAKEISVDILHLHGRVNDGENMVITEDDYRDYYLKPKDNREHIQNGLDVIWGGNPIVFMGVGLQEEDLLRPLRQFVSLKPKERRPIIAFMPQLLTSDAIGVNKSNAEILSLYIKYGVFVLKYGDEKRNDDRYQFTLGDECELIGKVKIFVKSRWLSKKQSDIADTHNSQNNADKFQKDIEELFDREANVNDQGEQELIAKEFIDLVEKQNYKELERYLPRVSVLNVDLPAFVYLIIKLVLSDRCDKTLPKLLVISMLEFLDDLKSKIITVAFGQFTDHIRHEKTKWWQHWQEVLAPRLNKFSPIPYTKFAPCVNKESEKRDLPDNVSAQKLLFGRHMYSFPRAEYFPNVDKLYRENYFDLILNQWKSAIDYTSNFEFEIDNKNPALIDKPTLNKSLVFVLKAKSSADISHFVMRLVRDFHKSKEDHLLTQYRACYVINTALSVEFLSVLSGLLSFIHSQLDDKSSFTEKELQLANRLEIFESLLKAYGEQYEKQPNKKLLVTFAHFDTLLSEKSGLYSNTVAQFIKCYEKVAELFQNNGHGLGIDIVLIGNKVKMTRFVGSHLQQLYPQKEVSELDGKLTMSLELLPKQGPQYNKAISELIDKLRGEEEFLGKEELIEKSAQLIAPFKDICNRVNYSYYAMMLLIGTIKFEFDSIKNGSIEQVLKKQHFDDYVEWLTKTADDVSHSNTDHRSRVLISQIIFRYTSLERKPYNPAWRLEIALRLAILRYMSAIHQPITLKVLYIAPEIVKIFAQHRTFLGREYLSVKSVNSFKQLVLHELRHINHEFIADIIKQLDGYNEFNFSDHLYLESEFNVLFMDIANELKREGDNLKPLFEEVRNKQKQIIESIEEFVMHKAIDELEDYHFVVPIISMCDSGDIAKSEKRYALHRVMQEQIERIHGSKIARRGERNFYDFNCILTAPRDMPFLDKDRYKFLMEYVDRLIELPYDYQSNPRLYSSRIRAAFSIIRSHINMPVLTRIELMEDDSDQYKTPDSILNEHQERLRILTDSAKKLAQLSKLDKVGKFRQPLYIDESSWLYNERGMFAYAQGKFYQAIPLFSLTRVNNPNFHHELDVKSGEQVTHNLNQYTTMIERGALQEAYIRLTDLQERLPHKQDFHQYACSGLIGRILYIMGRLRDAEKHFEFAMEGIREMNKIRAIALFGRQYAQLLAVKGDLPKAHEALTEAIASAESTQQQDILHYCRFTEALMSIVGENVTDNDRHFALVKLEVASAYAEKMGMHELHAKTCFARAQVLLATRQTKGASTIAAEGLALATKYGMTLMEAKGIVIYANIAIQSGDIKTGKQLLQKGIKLAERIKYQLLVERAHQSLMAIDNKVRHRSFADFGIQLSVDSYLGF